LTVFDHSRPSLKQCYDTIKGLVSSADTLEVVKEVEKYRNLWRPKTVKVILLAESHVHTSNDDFREWSFGRNPTYSGRLVRFVYCLGYGENLVKISSNPGTSQFWKILYSCVNEVSDKKDFAPILKSMTRDRDQRLRNKIDLLMKLKNAGIWLLDASIIGIDKEAATVRKTVLLGSWDTYTGLLLRELRPRHIIVIGIGVGRTLKDRILDLATPYNVIPQPQGWRRPGYNRFYKECFELCAKFADI